MAQSPYPPYLSPLPSLQQRARRYFNPYFSTDTEPDPATGQSSLEPYLGSAAIAEQLRQYKRDAMSQGLLQAGGAILSAPSLMEGLGAGAQAFSTPLGEYQKARRELPTQAALALYGVEGAEQERDIAQAGEEHRAALRPSEIEQAAYQGPGGRGRTLAEGAAEAQIKSVETNTLGQEFQNKLLAAQAKYGDETVGLAMMKALQDLEQGAANINFTKAKTESENVFRGPQAEVLSSTADYNREARGRYGAGGLTASTVITNMDEAMDQARTFLGAEYYSLKSLDPSLVEGIGLFFASVSTPPQYIHMDPRLATAKQINADLDGAASPADIQAKYANTDPETQRIFNSVVAARNYIAQRKRQAAAIQGGLQ